MKTPDVNVLVNGVNERSIHHDIAVEWLNEAFSGPELVGMSWFALTGFLRIATGSVLAQPLEPVQALALADDWLGAPNVKLIGPGERHFQILQRLTLEHDRRGRSIPDVHLAAISIENDATLATFNSDFHRFAELKLEYLGAR